MSKRNFSVPMLDIRKEPILEPARDSEGRPNPRADQAVALSQVIADCLLSNLKDDNKLTGTQKIEIHRLAERLVEGGSREYTIQELGLIETRCLEAASILVYGQLSRILNSDPVPTAAEKPGDKAP